MRGTLQRYSAGGHDLRRELGVADLVGADADIGIGRRYEGHGITTGRENHGNPLLRAQPFNRRHSGSQATVSQYDVHVGLLFLVTQPSRPAVAATLCAFLKSTVHSAQLLAVARQGVETRAVPTSWSS